MRFELWFPIFVSVALMLFMVAVLILSFRFKREFVYPVRNHTVLVEVSMHGVFLYVDGKLEEQVMASGLRLATLRADIEGKEFKAHVRLQGFFRTEVSATYGGREVSSGGMV